MSSSSSLALYSEMLSAGAGGIDTATVVRFLDGSERPLLIERWTGAADEIDERCLALLAGPVLDVGCGPGRHLHALARRGEFGLGVDISPAAVQLARGAGANAIVASIFDDLPGTGHWRSALLLDGNIGIGGRPKKLLRRIAGLLAPDGQLLVELAPPPTVTVETLVRLETDRSTSDWFPWAELSACDVDDLAARAGLEVDRRWNEDGRWFALLRLTAITPRVMALRAMPEVGGSVLIDYLGSTLRGVVSGVDEQGRRLEVATEDGRRMNFELNRATATFTADGSQTGPRLSFDSPAEA